MPDLSMMVPRLDFDLLGSKRGSEGFQKMLFFNFLAVLAPSWRHLGSILEGFGLDFEGFPLRKDYTPSETYKDMTINPVHKMNIGEREFGAKHAHIKGASTSIKNYTVEAPADTEEINN